MAMKIGINGFGRIGRQVYRAIRERYDEEMDVVAVNDIGRIKIMTHLLKYDSTYGRFPGEVVAREDGFMAGGDEVKVLAERDPSRLPWGKLGVDIVVESTGLFRKRDKVQLLRRRLQLTAKPAGSSRGFHRIGQIGHKLVDVLARGALKCPDIEAKVAGRNPSQHRFCSTRWT